MISEVRDKDGKPIRIDPKAAKADAKKDDKKKK